jgi:hypothetical protein
MVFGGFAKIFSNEQSEENQKTQSLLGRTLLTMRFINIIVTAAGSLSAAGREMTLLLVAYFAGSVPQLMYLQKQGEGEFGDLTKNFSAQILLLANVLAFIDSTYYGAHILSPSTTSFLDWTMVTLFIVPASFVALVLHLIRAIAVFPALLIEQQRAISSLGWYPAAGVAVVAATLGAAAQKGEALSRRIEAAEAAKKQALDKKRT